MAAVYFFICYIITPTHIFGKIM